MQKLHVRCIEKTPTPHLLYVRRIEKTPTPHFSVYKPQWGSKQTQSLSLLQYLVVCYSVLVGVAVCLLRCEVLTRHQGLGVLRCRIVCCGVVSCVACRIVCCTIASCVAVSCSLLQSLALSFSIFQFGVLKRHQINLCYSVL